MPARLIVSLRPKLLHEQGPWADTGPAVQAHVLRAVKGVDSDLADRLHHGGSRDRSSGDAARGRPAPSFRPYAITPLRRPGAGGDAPWRFEVGVLDDTLADTLGDALKAAELVRIGHSSFLVESIDAVGVGYEELVARSRPATRWRLRLLTPTTFRLPNEGGARRAVPLPLPDRVFGSLARRLTFFAGPGVLDSGTQTVIDGHLALADFELRSARHLTKGPDIREVGCVGEVRYEAVGAGGLDPAALQGISALVNFVAFAGIGDQTTKGMGCALPLDRPS